VDDSEDVRWERWFSHWLDTAGTFIGYAELHRDAVWWGRAPAATQALEESLAALTPPKRTVDRAIRSLHASGEALGWLVCDPFYSADKSPGELGEWLLGRAEAFDGEPARVARPVVETRDRARTLVALREIAARYDLSKSRGRSMRPVAPGIAYRLLDAAMDALLELAAAAARLSFVTDDGGSQGAPRV
jgi:hypothetical protein